MLTKVFLWGSSDELIDASSNHSATHEGDYDSNDTVIFKEISKKLQRAIDYLFNMIFDTTLDYTDIKDCGITREDFFEVVQPDDLKPKNYTLEDFKKLEVNSPSFLPHIERLLKYSLTKLYLHAENGVFLLFSPL